MNYKRVKPNKFLTETREEYEMTDQTTKFQGQTAINPIKCKEKRLRR
jgi:hypothetical protein